MAINRKAIQWHMREMVIVGISPGPHLSRRDSEHRVYPYLMRDLTSAYPNHVWGSMSHIFVCEWGGCIWSPCSIGSRAT